MLLSVDEKSRLIEMAWEENKPFQAIEQHFGLSEGQVNNLMAKYLQSKTYSLWRDRVTSPVTQ